MVAPVAAVADDPEQSIGSAVAADLSLHSPIGLFVAAMHRAAHAWRAVNDFEYASTDEFAAVAAVAAARAHRRHSDEVEIASDQKRSMICDSDLDDSVVDLSFAIAVESRASNDSASVRLSCVVDTMHFDPFAHGRSRRAVPVDPVDAVSSR